jgi:hypothetical protein
MDKGIGFNRNIKLDWLNATAAFCTETNDRAAIGQRLDPVIRQEVSSPTNVRKTVAILLNIWCPTDKARQHLCEKALQLFQKSAVVAERTWLHYGLVMAAYPFFRQAVTAIGQLSRYEEVVTPMAVREKLYAELGELGSVEKAVTRVIFSLRDWGILTDADQRNGYIPQYRALTTGNADLERWLLACALRAHAVEEMSFADLLHLPALFPFRFTVTVYDLRQSAAFDVQRQGLGFDMVRAA